jgi:hypothetical protein
VAEVEETLAAREVCNPSNSFPSHDELNVFLVRNSLSLLICIMSGRCILKLWSSFASKYFPFSVLNTAKTRRRLSEKEMDMKDKLGPSITYLQRLGSEYLDTVFQYSKWILDENSEMGLEVSSVVYVFYAAC